MISVAYLFFCPANLDAAFLLYFAHGPGLFLLSPFELALRQVPFIIAVYKKKTPLGVFHHPAGGLYQGYAFGHFFQVRFGIATNNVKQAAARLAIVLIEK